MGFMKQALTVITVALGAAAFGTEYEVQDPTSVYQYLRETFSWKDVETGLQPALPPTNRTDTLVIEPAESVAHVRVYNDTQVFDHRSIPPMTLAAVTSDDPRVTFSYVDRWFDGYSSQYQVGDNNLATLTVLDPNGFLGYWYSAGGRIPFGFPSTASKTNVVSSFSACSRAVFTVPDAGTATKLGELYDRGAVEKAGEGEVILGGTPGTSTRIFVREGSVTLDGTTRDDIDGVLAKAAIRFDASDVATLARYEEDGRTWVTNWYDAGGSGVSAWKPRHEELAGYPSRIQYANSPFVVEGASPSGLAVLDFGSRSQAGVEPQFGPTNVFFFIPRMENVREVFYVARYHEQPSYNPVVGEHNVISPFIPEKDAVLSWGAAARDGTLFVNGRKCDNNDNPDGGAYATNFFTFSCSTRGDVAVNTLCSDLKISERTGGMQVGEVLIFTNVLPRAERTLVNAYLHDKWIAKGAASADANEVVLKASGTSLGVGAGRTAKVSNLVTETGTFVKTGEGTLEYDTLSPAGATLEVKAGAVRAVHPLAAPALTPAADPIAWFDASVASSRPEVSYEGVIGKFVPTWSDWRDNGVTATATSRFNTVFAAPNLPTVVTGGAPTGLDVLDFGSTEASYSGYALPWYSYASSGFKRCVKSAFVVLRNMCGDHGTYARFFGSKDQTFMREGTGGHSRLTAPHYAHPTLVSAAWSVNGVPCDPTTKNLSYADSDFKVIGFSGADYVLLDAICCGMENRGAYTGCFQIGEYIVFDRELSEKERRDTEAYLLKKWLGKDHPFAGTQTVSFAFAEDVDPVIDAEGDMTVARVQGGTGDVIKRGTGSVDVEETIGDGWKSVSVEGGELIVSVPGEPDDGTYYHFDASAIDTMTYTVEGGKTNVSVWADVDGRDICATNITMDYAQGAPKLENYLFQDGQYRSGLDFGNYVSTAAHAMWMSESCDQFKEGLAVYRQQGSDYRPSIFSTIGYVTGKPSPYSGTIYSRGSNGELATSDHPETYTDWYVYDYASDSVVLTNGSCALKDMDPHLINTVPQSPCRVDAIAFQQVFGGGQIMFEQIGFTNQLSAARRDWWQRHLAYKWFGQGVDPVWTNCYLSAVSVAADATLTLTGAANPIVAALSGAGTVNATTLQGVGSLSFDIEDVANGDALVVNGAVTFADAVHVTVGGSAAIRLPPGNYTLLQTSEDLGDLDLSSWTVDVSELSDKRTYAVRQIGNRIVLSVQQKGLAVIVR